MDYLLQIYDLDRHRKGLHCDGYYSTTVQRVMDKRVVLRIRKNDGKLQENYNYFAHELTFISWFAVYHYLVTNADISEPLST